MRRGEARSSVSAKSARMRGAAIAVVLLTTLLLPTAGALGSATQARGAAGPARGFAGTFPRHPREKRNGVSLTPSKTKPYWACPEQLCGAIVDPVTRTSSRRWGLPSGGPLLEGSGEKGGYDPQDLQSAYRVPAAGGSTQTVALVDALGDPTAESDLIAYREHYGLEACTKANGCFHKVNQEGKESGYPEANKGWEGETALDLDMVSAACPHCHILLVEAKTASVANLAESENTAASLGATEISNSYGVAEELCGSGHCESLASAYKHAGVLIVASSGDSGYDNHYEKDASPSFPATVPNVLAVGGTSLHKGTNARGWTEAVWNEPSRELGTGSGCSLSEAKPSWQFDKGCTKRSDNDVASDAACETPLSVYSTPYGGWEDFCGTSASAPFVTAILAHAGAHTRSLGPQAFYENRSDLFSVSTGSNGTCTPEYLCNAEKQEAGYDGPIGLGTPDGLPSPAPAVSAVGPRVGPPAGGTSVTISGANFEEVLAVRFGASAAKSFTVSSAGSISAVAPAGSGTVDVTVETVAGVSPTSVADHFSYFAAPHYALEIPHSALGGTPSALAVNSEGDVWVSELASPAVKEFSPTGAFIRALPATLESPCTGSLSESVGLAVDAKGNLWVTDRANDRVLEFSPEGHCTLEFGAAGGVSGQFETPQGIAIGPAGHVFVVDSGNARVQEFSETGGFIRQFAVHAPAAADPWGIAVAPNGHVWVSLMISLGPAPSVHEFTEAGEPIGFVRSAEGSKELFEWPAGLALTASGELLVAYFEANHVEAFAEGGEALGRFGSCCGGESQFEWPLGVATDAAGDVWITETRFGRVEKWAAG